MTNQKTPLNGFGTDIFAGIPVKDFRKSLEWYERLFGSPPSFSPNDVEAVWQISSNQWIYIIVSPGNAGHSIQNVMVTDLDKLISQIAERGIDYEKEERPADNARKVMYYDPDGNEIGLIRVSE